MVNFTDLYQSPAAIGRAEQLLAEAENERLAALVRPARHRSRRGWLARLWARDPVRSGHAREVPVRP